MKSVANNMEKACPICDTVDKAEEAQVTPSHAIIYRFKCSRCGFPHQRSVKPPNLTVDPLEGFRREPYRWRP